MAAPLSTQLPPGISSIGMPFAIPSFPASTSFNLPSLLSASGGMLQQELPGATDALLRHPFQHRPYVVAPPSLDLGSASARSTRSIRPPAPPPRGPRALSLVAKRSLVGIPDISDLKAKEIVDAWLTVVDFVVPGIAGSGANPLQAASQNLVTSSVANVFVPPGNINNVTDTYSRKPEDLRALLVAADIDCANTQSHAVKQAAQLEAELVAATADTRDTRETSTCPVQLTGMELLKAMADDQQTGSSEFAETQPVSGYAKASVMHRVVEHAIANMRTSTSVAIAPQQDPEDLHTNSDNQIGGSIFLGSIPRGTSEGLIVSECKKFGTISSLYYDAHDLDILEGGWALVHFASRDHAQIAAQRMSRRPGLFGAAAPVVVRLSTQEDFLRVERHRSSRTSGLSGSHVAGDKPPDSENEQGARRKQSRSRSRQTRVAKKDPEQGKKMDHRRKEKVKSCSRDRRVKRRERKRRHARSRHRSRDRKKKTSSSSSSSSSDSKRSTESSEGSHSRGISDGRRGGGVAGMKGFDAKASGSTLAVASTASMNAITVPIEEPSGGRQVGTRGTWAEFATPDCRTYFVNILTMEKQWHRPAGYDSMASRRPGAPSVGHSNVYVGNLPLGIHEVGFRQLFQSHGNIISIKLMPSKKAGGNDYGFVKYGFLHEAETAIKMMHGVECNGSRLSVKFAMEDKKY